MKKLKNEMAAIIERDSLMYATPNGNMVVCETLNGKYEFPAEMTEEILRRAGEMGRASKINLVDTSNRTQACLLYMRDNPDFLKALYGILHLTEQVKSDFSTYTPSQAASYAAKQYKNLRPYFRYTNVGWRARDANNRSVPIKIYLDLLPIVPKAWIKDIKL